METSSGINEKNDLDYFENPIDNKILKVIPEQTKNSLCHIKNNEGDNSIGFFCVIPFINNNNLLPILVLNNANFKENTINKIFITLCNNKNNTITSETSEIIIDNKRKIFLDEEINISFIEIKDKDNIDKNLFLFLDEKNFNDDLEKELLNKQIYLIYYLENNYSDYTTGIIKKINKQKKYFEFISKNRLSSSGYPIFNFNNNRIIGIQTEHLNKEDNYHKGLIFNDLIELFFNKEFDKDFDNIINDVLFSSITKANEENILSILSKFNNNDKLALELKEIMKEKNISYEGLNNKYQLLIKAIIDLTKKELIQPLKTQINFIMPLNLRISSNKNNKIKEQIKVLLRSYEKEALNISLIIFLINKLNNQLFESLKVISQEIIKNKQNKDDIKIVKDNKQTIQKFSKKYNLINKYYTNDISIFINLFKDLADIIIVIKNKIEYYIKIFKNSSSIFENTKNNDKINNTINNLKNNLNDLFELIENKKEIIPKIFTNEKIESQNNLFIKMLIICKNLKDKIYSIINNIDRYIINIELKGKIFKNLNNAFQELIQKINLGNENHKINQNNFLKNNEI